MNIPAVVNLGTDFTKEYDGREAIVDGYNGKLIISPNQEATAYYTKKQMQEKANRALLREQLGKDNVTQDGRKIHLLQTLAVPQISPMLWKMTPAVSGCSEVNFCT